MLRIKRTYYPRRAPRPPRLDSVLRFKEVKRSSLSFKKRAIFCSNVSFGARSLPPPRLSLLEERLLRCGRPERC